MSRSSTVCVDASIVVRHVASTVDAEIAELWSDWHHTGTAMVAPSLLHYEVVNALHQYMARGVRTATAVNASLRAALALPITMYDDNDLHERAAEMATKYKLPATYDAHYLALADRLGVEFYTADIRLANAVRLQLDWVRRVGNT